ncbi:MAG: hypothetical protein AAF715_05855 [Myxococcota bacterium]
MTAKRQVPTTRIGWMIGVFAAGCLTASTASASPAAHFCDANDALAKAIEASDAIAVAEFVAGHDQRTELPDGQWSGRPCPRSEVRYRRAYRVQRVLHGKVFDAELSLEATCRNTNPPGYPRCRVPLIPPKGSQRLIFLRRGEDGQWSSMTPPDRMWGAPSACRADRPTEEVLSAHPEVHRLAREGLLAPMQGFRPVAADAEDDGGAAPGDPAVDGDADPMIRPPGDGERMGPEDDEKERDETSAGDGPSLPPPSSNEEAHRGRPPAGTVVPPGARGGCGGCAVDAGGLRSGLPGTEAIAMAMALFACTLRSRRRRQP